MMVGWKKSYVLDALDASAIQNPIAPRPAAITHQASIGAGHSTRTRRHSSTARGMATAWDEHTEVQTTNGRMGAAYVLSSDTFP